LPFNKKLKQVGVRIYFRTVAKTSGIFPKRKPQLSRRRISAWLMYVPVVMI